MKKPIDFQLMKINRDAQKVCKCNPPTYEIDPINRLVQCTKCNAYIQPFDALMSMSERIEQYTDEIERLVERKNELANQINQQIDQLNELSERRFRMNVFRNLQNEYMRGMMPSCPHCERPFDPTEISYYTNEKYCDYKRKEGQA